MELTKKEIDALFSDKFLDNNGNIDKNKIKSLDTNLLHSLAETFSDTYKVKTRYTAEQLLKKLFEDFKIEMRNPVSLSDVTTTPKVIKTGYLLFNNKTKLSDYTFSNARNKIFVNNTLDYNMMDMIDLYCLSNVGFREDLSTGNVQGCNLLPFKHMPAMCVVTPNGTMLVKKDGKVKIGTTGLEGNEVLTLEDIFCFIIGDIVANLSAKEKQNLAESITDYGLMNAYAAPFNWENCFDDTSILTRNNINGEKWVYYPKDLELMRGVNLLSIHEQSYNISDKNRDRVNFVKVTAFKSGDKTYNVYYNEHIFDNHGKNDISLQDYIYLKDVILRVIGFFKVAKEVNREVMINGKKSITYIYKPSNIANLDVMSQLQGILRGYKLITPFIKKVDFEEKLNSTYYYQVV